MFSAEALSFRQQSRLAIGLSWVGGFTNVFAYLTLANFASHMTGASTLIGLNLARADGAGFLYIAAVGAFFAGAMASTLMTEMAKRRGVRSKYLFPLTVEALLLALLVICLHAWGEPQAYAVKCELLGLTAFSMGLQNATITRISGAVVRSTHLTGVITDLGIETVQLGMWAWDQMRQRTWRRAGRVLRVSQRHPTLLRVALLASIWASFVFGAIVGGFAYGRYREMALCGPIGFLLVLVVLQFRKPTVDIRELDVLSDPELKLHGLVHALLPAELGIYRMMHDPRRHFHAPNFSLWVERLAPAKLAVILLVSPAMSFDATALVHLQAAISMLESQGRRLIIAGVNPKQYKQLAHEHVVERIGASHVCPDVEFAIGLGVETVRELRERR
jgi:uncharacterized membrane protein YoaK (UPF0700 family)